VKKAKSIWNFEIKEVSSNPILKLETAKTPEMFLIVGHQSEVKADGGRSDH
jgi:hypothetical protein